MSKSLERVLAEAERLGLFLDVIETPSGTHTAQMAANFVECELGQIAKSILMRQDDRAVMFITSGANRVNLEKAQKLAGSLEKADATFIREVTGFAIGGVSPLGSRTAMRKFFDHSLLNYSSIYAAAGTPHALFEIDPNLLCQAIEAEIGEFIN